MTTPIRSVPFADLVRASAKVGFLGFGGPAGQIALMHRVFVDEKKWIDEARYLHALNYCMLLPGPEAQQLAVYVGWLVNGVRGGIVAGILFVLPGAFVILALSWLYAAHADAPGVAAVFYGVKAAVLAIVVEAVLRISRRALKQRSDILLAVIAFIALYVFAVPYPLVILSAGLVGGLWSLRAESRSSAIAIAPTMGGSLIKGVSAAALWAGLWLAPVAGVWAVAGRHHILTEIGLLFSNLALVTFGGAYAVLAYLQQQAVEAHGWLSPDQMIDGLGLAETTPGPLVLVNQFVGFQAGWNSGQGLLLALACAAMASWCTFAPSFLWIFAGAPVAERLRDNAFAQGALRAITAAVLGVVASLALWFSLHVLFADIGELATPWGRSFATPRLASLDPFAAALAAGAGLALIRYKTNMIAVIAACAGAALVRNGAAPFFA
jgi:chromate transporter